MHTEDILALTAQVMDRIKLIEHWKKDAITQVEAARVIELSARELRVLTHHILSMK